MLLRELIVDACAIMNLIAGDAAEGCLECIDPKSQVTPAIARECHGQSRTAKTFRALIEAGLLDRCDVEISADDLIAFMAAHDLGAGESEAILACQQAGRHFWSDDRKARNVAMGLIGRVSVTGTIGILKELVRLGDWTAEDAFASYRAMRTAGSYLPLLTPADFPAQER